MLNKDKPIELSPVEEVVGLFMATPMAAVTLAHLPEADYITLMLRARRLLLRRHIAPMLAGIIRERSAH